MSLDIMKIFPLMNLSSDTPDDVRNSLTLLAFAGKNKTIEAVGLNNIVQTTGTLAKEKKEQTAVAEDNAAVVETLFQAVDPEANDPKSADYRPRLATFKTDVKAKKFDKAGIPSFATGLPASQDFAEIRAELDRLRTEKQAPPKQGEEEAETPIPQSSLSNIIKMAKGDALTPNQAKDFTEAAALRPKRFRFLASKLFERIHNQEIKPEDVNDKLIRSIDEEFKG